MFLVRPSSEGWRWLALCLLIITPSRMHCIDIAKSLTQLLDNYKDASSLPRDVHFGLNLAYKLLSGISVPKQQQPSGDSDRKEFYWKTLEYLKVLKSASHTPNVSVYDEIILGSISLNFEVWQRPIKYRQLNIVKSKDTFEEYEWIVDKGLPTATESDRCMAQLGTTKTCVISSKCVAMMTSSDPAYGYHKTHQCANHLPPNQSLDVIIEEKCSDIYREHTILLQSNVPDSYRDLFIEQSLFCGMAGFSEFLATRAINLIPLWQSSDGCFNARHGEKDNSSVRCMDHINSLGVAFYSNLLRVFMKLKKKIPTALVLKLGVKRTPKLPNDNTGKVHVLSSAFETLLIEKKF